MQILQAAYNTDLWPPAKSSHRGGWNDGLPPVIGSDGIIYGVYETLDIAPLEITPPNENMVWTTEAVVPKDLNGFYILLSVEFRKPRTYIIYALDITEK